MPPNFRPKRGALVLTTAEKNLKPEFEIFRRPRNNKTYTFDEFSTNQGSAAFQNNQSFTRNTLKNKSLKYIFC
jgi:hypothetical protein